MELLIKEGCQVNYGDDRGGVHQDAGDFVEVTKETAVKLTETGRALYVKKADDPNKDARFTATKEEIEAAKALQKAKAADSPQA